MARMPMQGVIAGEDGDWTLCRADYDATGTEARFRVEAAWHFKVRTSAVEALIVE